MTSLSSIGRLCHDARWREPLWMKLGNPGTFHEHAPRMRSFSTLLALTVLGLAGTIGFAGCKSSNDIFAANFDQACTKATDCIVVWEGQVGCCFEATAWGGNAAINVSALSSYEAEASLLESCDQDIACAEDMCASGTQPKAECLRGTCVVGGT